MVAYKYYVTYDVYRKGKVIDKGAGEVYLKKKVEGEEEEKVIGDNFLSRYSRADEIRVTSFSLIDEVIGEKEED